MRVDVCKGRGDPLAIEGDMRGRRARGRRQIHAICQCVVGIATKYGRTKYRGRARCGRGVAAGLLPCAKCQDALPTLRASDDQAGHQGRVHHEAIWHQYPKGQFYVRPLADVV